MPIFTAETPAPITVRLPDGNIVPPLTLPFSKYWLINNTGADLAIVDEMLMACIKEGKPLPEEWADTFTLDVYTAEDGSIRGRVGWA